MQIPVVDTTGASVDTVEVSDFLFNVPMHTAVVHQATVRQQANARQGTSSTKTRAEVSGGGIKPRPQKHSGRSRQGSIRSPQWEGGGIVFGPKPRSYRQRIPKKMRRLAIRCLLSDKVRENRMTVLQSLDLADAKTHQVKTILQALNVESSVLLVTPDKNQNLVLSARNLKKVTTLPANEINVMDLLRHDRLIMTVDALWKAQDLWGDNEPGATEDSISHEDPADNGPPVDETTAENEGKE